MSKTYIAYINEENHGPLTREELQTMWDEGNVNNDTFVRYSDMAGWSTLEELLAAERQAELGPMRSQPVRSKPAVARSLSRLERLRAHLHAETAYPAFRGFLIVGMVLVIAGGVLSGIAIFNQGWALYGIAGLAACISLAISIPILSVLLDIADAVISKSE